MKNQYKYYFKTDKSKEAIGIVKANDLEEAYIKSAYKKKLEPMHFKELFDLEEII